MLLSEFLSASIFFSFAAASVRFFTQDDEAGSIFRLEQDPDKHYFLPGVPSKEVRILTEQGSAAHATFGAATSIRVSSSPLSRRFLDAQFDAFKAIDDVWNENFVKTLFIAFERQDMRAFFDDSGKDWLLEKGVQYLFITDTIDPPKFKKANDLAIHQVSDVPPHGPWLVRTRQYSKHLLRAYPVYGLVEDDYDAFTVGALPDPVRGGYTPTNFTLDSRPGANFIPVPSRLSAWSGGSLPLAGMRFAVKDIFDVKGLRTGAGSAAYFRTYNKAETTAPSIQHLLDLGATLVGKTRTSQFAHGAQPWEFVDFQYSRNPRGDGYLTAGTSSSGSACAIAAYDWLDFTVGSDTGGSIRKPAALVGAFGLRPSHGTLDMGGVIALSEHMDTLGFFARDPMIFESLGKNWYADSSIINRSPTLRLPRHLLYPTDHFPLANEDAQILVDRFKHLLRKHLSITTKPIDMTETLTPHFPSESLEKFQQVFNILSEWRTWHDVGKPLVRAYVDKFGAESILDLEFDPVSEMMFKKGKQLTQSDFVEAMVLKNRFGAVLDEQVFPSNSKTCADSLFMYDAATGGKPSFRTEELNGFEGAAHLVLTSPPKGSTGGPRTDQFFHYVASMAGLPEVTIPLGQVQYTSPITGQWEWMPVAVQIATKRGCDGVLYELIRKLGDKGIVKAVQAGKEAYIRDSSGTP